MKFRFLLALIGITLIACQTESSKLPTQNQGVFDFGEEILSLSSEELPHNLDETKILCKGKGLKVARCISNQLKRGICLGIVKGGKDVYVVEIDCVNLNEEEDHEDKTEDPAF